ncbi:hypothetical protein DFP74_4992 [Nocardiopsis sp. Huas11]|nr:hypothetical protein [Nocardiopsis sp. Huas11]RKS09259.1 hypothetical protein DFP74_4992 [Nocardiopsis sp. Huas11]
MSDQVLTNAEFDDLFDLSVTEVGEGAVPFGKIAEGSGAGCYSDCARECK